MKDDILTYREMCDSEGVQTLQRGMNFRLSTDHSVVLMSQRSNAPYRDVILDDGLTILYEGHDEPCTQESPNPKTLDQPRFTKKGNPTQNGKFVEAVEIFISNGKVEKVRAYEKLFPGVWSFRGLFDLVGYEYLQDGCRKVFRFKLHLTTVDESNSTKHLKTRSRIIPTAVKKEVWIRDGGQCTVCGATDELHFDHDIPYSKGGSSITVENVKILCARHNLSKGDKIL